MYRDVSASYISKLYRQKRTKNEYRCRKLFVMSADGGSPTRLINLSGYTYQMVPDWQPLQTKDPCTLRGTINSDKLDKLVSIERRNAK